MQPTNADQVRREALDFAIQKGAEYEVLTNQEGWKYLMTYIEAQIKNFATTAINNGFPSMEEFNLERGKVKALQALLSEVESAIQTTRNERQKGQ